VNKGNQNKGDGLVNEWSVTSAAPNELIACCLKTRTDLRGTFFIEIIVFLLSAGKYWAVSA
jgi:hypothetical protein